MATYRIQIANSAIDSTGTEQRSRGHHFQPSVLDFSIFEIHASLRRRFSDRNHTASTAMANFLEVYQEPTMS